MHTTQSIVEIATEHIPRNLFAACPKKNFSLVNVATVCTACPWFNHFIEVAQADPFRERYRVVCAHPIGRRMTEVEI